MFTADGELRQAYQHLDQEVAEKDVDSSSAPASTHPSSEVSTEAPSPAARQVESFGGGQSLAEQPVAEQPAEQALDSERMADSTDPELEPEDLGEGAPGFIDLVRLLAEHASIYIMQSRAAPPVEASENLELARLHIDLLSVLKQKTRGNLSSNEQALLDDAIGQLRAGLVGLQG